jgi:hypothetical protein
MTTDEQPTKAGQKLDRVVRQYLYDHPELLGDVVAYINLWQSPTPKVQEGPLFFGRPSISRPELPHPAGGNQSSNRSAGLEITSGTDRD